MMTSEEFAKNFYTQKQTLVELYFDGPEQTDVSRMIQNLGLDFEKLEILKEIIKATLRDAFYTTLLGLDGEAQIEGQQEMYRLTDEQGNELTGDKISVFAWEYFHNIKDIK